MAETPAQHEPVEVAYAIVQAQFRFLDVFSQKESAQYRQERQRADQRSDQRKGHGVRHGLKKAAGRPRKGVNGQVAGDDHGDGIEYGAFHVACRRPDHVEQVVLLFAVGGHFPKNVLHHHHGTVHNDAEIDRPDGQQVRGDVPPVQADEGEQQRERNGDGNDQSRADAEQHDAQDHENQQHAAEQVSLYGLRGLGDEVVAVVERHDLHVGRKDVLVKVRGHLLDFLDHPLRLFADAHQDDPLHGVVLLHEAELAEPDGVSDLDLGDVAQVNRDCVARGHDHISDVLQILDQAEAPDIVELPALRVEAAAGVGIVVAELLYDLSGRDAVGEQLFRIEQDVILHRAPAEARIVRYSRNGAVTAFKNPILDGLKFLRRPIETPEHVAIDQPAGGEERRQAGGDAVRHLGVRYALKRLLPYEVWVRVVLEVHLHRGQPIQRDRTQGLQLRDAAHFHFDRNRDEPLDFFGGVARPLGDDLHVRRGEVRISVDRQIPKSEYPPNHEGERRQHHQEALFEGEVHEPGDHERFMPYWLPLPNCRKTLPSETTRSPSLHPPRISSWSSSCAPRVTSRRPNAPGPVSR